MCEQHTAIDTESAKVQTHCLKMTDFRRFGPMGLQFGEHTASRRGLTASKRGKWRH